MSLGIAIKGPEGIVLAADSRVTLFNQIQPPPPAPAMLIPASFDNATKLLSVRSGEKSYVAAVTYGAGAIGPPQQPRTAHSFLPELDPTSALLPIRHHDPINNLRRTSLTCHSNLSASASSIQRKYSSNIPSALWSPTLTSTL